MKIQQWVWMIWEWNFTIKDIISWKERKVHEFNLIPTVAKTAFAAQISWDNTTDIWDNLYIALGSNTTTPTSWDTQLWTETTRKIVSSTTFSGAIWYISIFFAVWEATGTHREFWLFWNWNASTASATVNTGILFSHVAANISIASTETLTCSFQISFTS